MAKPMTMNGWREWWHLTNCQLRLHNLPELTPFEAQDRYWNGETTDKVITDIRQRFEEWAIPAEGPEMFG